MEEQNAVAMAYNLELQVVAIPKLRASLPGLELLYLDAYSLIYEMFNNPSKYGTQHELYFSVATSELAMVFADAFFFFGFFWGMQGSLRQGELVVVMACFQRLCFATRGLKGRVQTRPSTSSSILCTPHRRCINV